MGERKGNLEPVARMRDVRAVIFDLDGTLVDSEPLAKDAWRRVLAKFGYAVTQDDILSTQGRAFSDIHTYFAKRASLPGPESLWKLYASILFPSMDERPLAFRDSIATAIALKEAGVALGLASSSPRERVDYTLTKVGLHALFSVTVAGDEIRNGKPAPDLFLEVARRLRVAPAQCIAIEDSQPGVDAALAAGMCVVGILRPEGKSLKGATLLTDELSVELVNRLLREDPEHPSLARVGG
jgi:HAD superfamily hydrolase (TIGR01509 family)